MTPLAHRIVKELTLPIRRRTFEDHAGVLKRMSEVHCFECTAVAQAAIDLGREYHRKDCGLGHLGFLPAPRTWIEMASIDAADRFSRYAMLLEQDGDRSASVTHCFEMRDGSFSSVLPLGRILLREAHDGLTKPSVAFILFSERMFTAEAEAAVSTTYAFLALINTPRIVGRVTHLPHRGLEKALIAKHQSVGHWPLHAWHEIKLSITPPDAARGEIDEGHLTGKRALHFVRQHLRIRMGCVEYVSAHWRGDAQLGIKRTRYSVVH